MRQVAFGAVKLILATFIFSSLIYYLYDRWGDFTGSLNASVGHIVGLTVCVLATWLINNVQLLLLMNRLELRPGFFENLAVMLATFLANYLPLRIGTLLRFRYFHVVHDFHFVKFGSLQSVRILIMLGTTGVLGLAGAFWLKLGEREVDPFLWIVLLALPVGCVLLARFHPPTTTNENRLIVIWRLYWEGLDRLRQEPKLLFQITLLTLVQVALIGVRLYLSFDAVGEPIGLAAILFIAPATTLIGFLSLAPGNLGVREWALAALTASVGFDFTRGVFAGTLDRAVLLVLNVLLGTGCLVWMILRTERFSHRADPFTRSSG